MDSNLENIANLPEMHELPGTTGTIYNLATGAAEATVRGYMSTAGITYKYRNGGIHFLPAAASDVSEVVVNMATSLNLKSCAEALMEGNLERAAELITTCQVLFSQMATIRLTEKMVALGIVGEDDND